MNKEIKNREYVQGTFAELHAPEDLRRKVMNVTKTEAKKKRNYLVKRLSVAAAMAIVLFIGSNSVAYAMTGSTWVETLTAKININGSWQDVELEGEVLEDGTVQYSTSIEAEEDDTVEILLLRDVQQEGDVLFVTENNTPITRTEVVEEDGRIYFIDDAVKIDITEDMADGYATGNFERNGFLCQYEVKEEPGVPGCYEIHIFEDEKNDL